jgi:hypothetical protein
MLRKSWLLAIVSAVMIAGQARGGTFGKVVSIGGEAADLVLDEARGKLYIANFTANRIDVMSLATNTIQTSINVPAQPSSVALSPDGHWLLVSHYGNNTAPASPQNGLTVIDLTNQNAKQSSGGHHRGVHHLRSGGRHEYDVIVDHRRGGAGGSGPGRELPAQHHRRDGGVIGRLHGDLRARRQS